MWLRYLSWFGYANELLSVNQWKGLTGIECPSNTTFCFQTGDQIISYLKINPENYVLNFCCMVGLVLFWRAFTYLVLLIKVKRK